MKNVSPSSSLMGLNILSLQRRLLLSVDSLCKQLRSKPFDSDKFPRDILGEKCKKSEGPDDNKTMDNYPKYKELSKMLESVPFCTV